MKKYIYFIDIENSCGSYGIVRYEKKWLFFWCNGTIFPFSSFLAVQRLSIPARYFKDSKFWREIKEQEVCLLVEPGFFNRNGVILDRFGE